MYLQAFRLEMLWVSDARFVPYDGASRLHPFAPMRSMRLLYGYGLLIAQPENPIVSSHLFWRASLLYRSGHSTSLFLLGPS
jgi:hypothetical protein